MTLKLTRAAYLKACAEIINLRCSEGSVFHPGDIQYAAESVFEIGAEFLSRLNIKLEES